MKRVGTMSLFDVEITLLGKTIKGKKQALTASGLLHSIYKDVRDSEHIAVKNIDTIEIKVRKVIENGK